MVLRETQSRVMLEQFTNFSPARFNVSTCKGNPQSNSLYRTALQRLNYRTPTLTNQTNQGARRSGELLSVYEGKYFKQFIVQTVCAKLVCLNIQNI